jgi:hypothetical protein
MLILGLILACSFTGTVSAADTPPVHKGLSVSPLRTKISVKPGSTFTNAIKITNNTPETIDVDLTAEEFSVINEQYDYTFKPILSLKNYVRLTPAKVTLESGKSQKIRYEISAPIGAEPKGEYISLFATTKQHSPNGGIASHERVASLLYITIEGKLKRTGKLLSLRDPWAASGSAKWTASVQNVGTAHFTSRYEITTQTLFGTTAAENTGSAIVLPNTVRLIAGDIPKPQLPGLYKIAYHIGLGDTPAASTVHYILYIPPSFWLFLGGVGLLLTAYYFAKRTKRRKH